MDDKSGLLFVVTSIKTLRDNTIVAYVRHIGGKKESRAPIHIADVIRMM